MSRESGDTDFAKSGAATSDFSVTLKSLKTRVFYDPNDPKSTRKSVHPGTNRTVDFAFAFSVSKSASCLNSIFLRQIDLSPDGTLVLTHHASVSVT